MGDIEGSSNAAQGALHIQSEAQEAAVNGKEHTPETEEKTGLLGRLLGSFSTSSADAPAEEDRVTAPQAQPHGMINLRRMRVEDVAIPSAEIVAVPVTTDSEDLVKVFRESGLTRIPVYEGTLDTPLGFAHLKDFALTHGFNCSEEAFDLRKMLRPLLFVPPSMPIGVLLSKMQGERRHMALVIDEYGGVDGLVTIEDLIEQVIGEIEDEHDTGEDQTWFREKSGCYVAQARTPLAEFEAEIGQSLTNHDDVDEEEIDTLGGLVFMLSGRVPARGEVIVHPDGAEFEVVDADPRRIKRLRVLVPKSEE
ncbi:hemolysin family protein [Phaeobacter sp. QD34_3]|uniref:hemolysin family protein n=1 Tax=unclassified Phaeobacter TaxID=2621772 RepID=UPI00237F7754|nr:MULTISPECIES: hemolysin family protein [unclassified Phaeobacter]MDE4135048.1 hemolysin family protein [Phaeobacter sp. QD34_3]MDE4138678.1 hemolysin family protein [Phaeobacter sp. QD34_24]MDE4175358.1 hemolysin family protein [Phaeobacter sp. PT47_59]